jgi:signal transduction histidine kinase
VDLNALLGTLQKDAQLGSPEQSVRLNAEPQLTLTGWPTMIERAVDNLLRNAQRFNPVGQAIEMQATRQGERIVVSVRDHGPGVQAEHLSQLGEPFYRAPGQTAAGHGLGLAQAGGGAAWRESDPGQSSRGRVYCQPGIAAGPRRCRPSS